ncbi:MAG: hypothetical protein NVS1B14_10340 [Vulcanimicrobiaceae bacterium]
MNYSPLVAQAAANVRSAEFQMYSVQRTERVKVIGLYFDALRASATAQTRADAVRAIQADVRAATLRFQAGDAPHLDVVRAQVTLARAQADAENAGAARANAVQAIAVETGSNPLAFGQIVAEPADAGPPVPGDVNGAIEMAQARRSEIAAAQADIAAETSAVRAAERGIFPALTVGAGYTRGIDAGFPVAGPNLSAQLTLPLSGGSRAKVALQRAKLAEAEARYGMIRRDVALEVGAAMRTYQAGGRALRAAQEARRQAQAELDAVTVGYRSGASSSLEVTAARQTFLQAALDEITARYAQAQARATLQLLLGGASP